MGILVPKRTDVKAYIFINAGQGRALAIAEAIRGMTGVLDVDPITGDFDVVAALEFGQLGGLTSAMTDIQKIEGVHKTTTCLVLSEP
jgi:DNA-binding Lrp family transcriptional regulator